MSEKTELLKKYVLTTVGATTSVDRIKTALNDAVTDLCKVGQDLLDELEVKGKGIINDYTHRQNPIVRLIEKVLVF